MSNRKSVADVVNIDDFPELKIRKAQLEAQRSCMRVPDTYWAAMKRRAIKSGRPIIVALESELNKYAHKLLSQF